MPRNADISHRERKQICSALMDLANRKSDTAIRGKRYYNLDAQEYEEAMAEVHDIRRLAFRLEVSTTLTVIETAQDRAYKADRERKQNLATRDKPL